MDPTDIAFIKFIIAFVAVAGTGLTAFSLWLRARARPGSESSKVIEALREENAQLQAELGARMNELEERVDFAERRLVQEREVSRLPEPPRAPTPV